MDIQQLGDNLQRRKEYIIIDERFRTEIEKFMDTQYTNSDIFKLIEAVSQEDVIQQHLGIIGIRKLLSVERNSPIQSIIDAGIIPRLICFANKQQYPQLQLQGLWSLTNIVSGTTAQCRSIVEQGAISLFISLVKSSNQHIAEQAVWALGNIASDCNLYRNQIIQQGGGPILSYHFRSLNDSKAINNCCWAISNLCRQTPIPSFQAIRELITVLCDALGRGLVTDKQSVADCCWAISYSSDSYEKQIVIVKSRVLQKLFQLLKEDQLNILIPTLKILQNISRIQEVINKVASLNIVQQMQKLIEHKKKNIRSCVCHILSNISTNKQQAEIIIRSQKLLKLTLITLENDSDNIRVQLITFFSNLVNMHLMQLYNYLKSSFIIDSVTKIFSIRKISDQTIQNVLKLLYRLIILQRDYCQNNQTIFSAQLRTNVSKLQILNIYQGQSILNGLKMVQMSLD